VAKATEAQLRDLRAMIAEYPGDYEVVLQVLPRESFLPIYLACCVDPSPEFAARVASCLSGAVVEVRERDDAFGDFDEGAGTPTLNGVY